MSILAKKKENTPKNAKQQPEECYIFNLLAKVRADGSPPCPPDSYATGCRTYDAQCYVQSISFQNFSDGFKLFTCVETI